ncbi:putative membrane protein [Actinoplanes tereljensis]|nr:hypothetical protein [Actinoplanes tereljensis]
MGTGWSLIVFAIVLPTLFLLAGLLIAQLQRAPHTSEPAVSDADRILADRFARGEIDSEDYEYRLRTLHDVRR